MLVKWIHKIANYAEMTLACRAGTSRLKNLKNVDSEDQPAASWIPKWTRRGDGGMGSDSDGALEPQGGVCQGNSIY